MMRLSVQELGPRCGKPATYPNKDIPGGPCQSPEGHKGECNPNRTRCGMCDVDWPAKDGMVHHRAGCFAISFWERGYYKDSKIKHVFQEDPSHKTQIKADLLYETIKNPDLTLLMLTNGWSTQSVVEGIDVVVDNLYPRKKEDALTTVKARKLGIKSQSGWLSPEGVFYGCKAWEHITLGHLIISELGAEGDAERRLEQRGWLKVTNASWLGDKAPTQAQENVIWDWCVHHNLAEKYDGIIKFLQRSAL